jgi:hypothetical protein
MRQQVKDPGSCGASNRPQVPSVSWLDHAVTRSHVGIAAICLLALCWAAVIVGPGANQTAHLATVHALARGSSNIDVERHWTGDTAYFGGHFYAAKAPGLALVTTPYFLLLEHVHLVPSLPLPSVLFPKAQERMPRTALWEVALFGAVLPGFLLLLLVRGVVDEVVPGFGSAAAIAVGGASILGIMATMFFDHALSACLAFASFAVLRRRLSVRACAAAGLLVGLAVVVELPLAIAVVVLGGYAFMRERQLLHLGAYASGAIVGVVPLLAFDRWAFGSPFTLAYSKAVSIPGVTGHDVLGQNSAGFFGVGLPDPKGMMDLLFSSYGLLVLAPIWGLALVGILLMRREGWKAEANVSAAIALLFLLYNSGYIQLFGGMTAGPRFLVPTIPFLALPLATAWRRNPLTAWSLCLASGVVSWTIIAANPMGPAEDFGTYFHRLERGANGPVALTGTVLHWLLPAHQLAEVLLVLALVTVAFGLAFYATPTTISGHDAMVALCALLAWRIVYTAGSTLFKINHAHGTRTGAAAIALVALCLGGGLYGVARSRWRLSAPAIGLLPLLWAHVDGNPRAVAALAAAVFIAFVAMAVPRSALRVFT